MQKAELPVNTANHINEIAKHKTETINNTAAEKLIVANKNTESKPRRELPKTSTIGEMFKEIHKEVVVEQNHNKIELTEASTLLLWSEFLIQHKDKLQNAFINAANAHTPILIGDRITFNATNNVSLEMLQLHKMDITAFFRNRTTSTTVSPDFILQRSEQVITYRTSKDRLKEMIDDNPAILNLIQKFELNLD